jgi:hypothetical protein
VLGFGGLVLGDNEEYPLLYILLFFFWLSPFFLFSFFLPNIWRRMCEMFTCMDALYPPFAVVYTYYEDSYIDKRNSTAPQANPDDERTSTHVIYPVPFYVGGAFYLSERTHFHASR